MKQEIDYLKTLAKKGGPEAQDYEELAQLYKIVNNKRKQGVYSDEDLMEIWRSVPEAYITTDTMQGYVLMKPLGYHGDYVIIERIYNKWLSPKPHLANWDVFFHQQAAPQAVVNRKKYFLDVLTSLNSRKDPRYVLNIGCGPSNDIIEFLEKENSHVSFECVDYDKDAIDYSFNKMKEKNLLHCVCFHRENALKYVPTKLFDLIWSAGLFDYLNDNYFKMLLNKMLNFVKSGGEIIIGNFSVNNPTRDYMECGNWFLYHRTEEDLIRLGIECGIPREQIRVGSEPLGVNLFLHLIK
ncbi:MAG TPA: methyltransferase domain-containing protein [Smithella sp.]|nr:methyltransferase domain-containing protein [Smithella sp.]